MLQKLIFFCFCNMVQFFSRSPNLNDGLCHRLEYSSSQALWSKRNKKWSMSTKKHKILYLVIYIWLKYTIFLIFQSDQIGMFSFTCLKNNIRPLTIETVKLKKFMLSNIMKKTYIHISTKLLFQFHFKKKPSTSKVHFNYFYLHICFLSYVEKEKMYHQKYFKAIT